MAVFERDPATKGYVQPFLFFKGFLALQTHRVSHWLWAQGRETLAFYLQSRASEVFQVDINPAARIGQGVFIDHGTGIVIGETAVVGDDVSMLHGVTLGGTGADRGDRHPKIGKGVLLGAGSKVLGNIQIGDYAKIASGSVVLEARAAALHGRRRPRADGQLPHLRRAGPDDGPHAGRRGLRLRDLGAGLFVSHRRRVETQPGLGRRGYFHNALGTSWRAMGDRGHVTTICPSLFSTDRMMTHGRSLRPSSRPAKASSRHR